MRSHWADSDAEQISGKLAQRIYTSRLLGRDPSLVLYGGGNTSVKLTDEGVFGPDEVLYVKGRGHDLATIDEGGFTPVRLDRLRELAALEQLSDEDMARELHAAVLDQRAPAPSVETMLHAILPHPYVDHSHAMAVLALTNTPSGEDHIRRAYGSQAVVIPYTRPGFGLARLCADALSSDTTGETIGLVLMNHGLVSFGASARESYERMITLVSLAEDYLAEHDALEIPLTVAGSDEVRVGGAVATLRTQISEVAGFPMVFSRDPDPASRAFARRDDVVTLSQSGPATPDHVLWTKRVPMIGRDVDAYADAYREYFAKHWAELGGDAVMLDPAPRVVLDPELGLCTGGRTAEEAVAAREIYRRTIDVILQATELEQWQALSPGDVFGLEYWGLEQSKLQREAERGEFEGEIVLVTGAASGIGAACAEAFLERGAAVFGIDIDPAVEEFRESPAYRGFACDITDEAAVARVIEDCASHFGGIDALVLSAGVFPASRRVGNLPLDEWRRVFSVNVDADLSLLRFAYPFLALSPKGGRVVVIASKNVRAPGPGAAAYSASKAALTQLARVAALEWGAEGIRVNTIHPNAVFDTAIWTDSVIRARAEQYGLSPKEYRTNNVLGVEVTSRDVAELAVAMCGPAFAKTTGAQVPVDGGNDRVI